jgi:hypothetical protein
MFSNQFVHRFFQIGGFIVRIDKSAPLGYSLTGCRFGRGSDGGSDKPILFLVGWSRRAFCDIQSDRRRSSDPSAAEGMGFFFGQPVRRSMNILEVFPRQIPDLKVPDVERHFLSFR